MADNNPNLSPMLDENFSEDKRRQFAQLQARLPALYEVFYDRTATRTVVIVPSASVDFEVLTKIKGVHLRSAVVNPELSHITCYNATKLERTLAVELDLPLYATNPDNVHFGSKSYGREVFRAAGVDLADGQEHIRDEQDLFKAVAAAYSF